MGHGQYLGAWQTMNKKPGKEMRICRSCKNAKPAGDFQGKAALCRLCRQELAALETGDLENTPCRDCGQPIKDYNASSLRTRRCRPCHNTYFNDWASRRAAENNLTGARVRLNSKRRTSVDGAPSASPDVAETDRLWKKFLCGKSA